MFPVVSLSAGGWSKFLTTRPDDQSDTWMPSQLQKAGYNVYSIGKVRMCDALRDACCRCLPTILVCVRPAALALSAPPGKSQLPRPFLDL